MRSSLIHSISYPFRDFLFQTECFHCGKSLIEGERRICSQCWRSLTVVNDSDHTVSVLKDRFRAGGVIDGVIALYYFEKRGLLQSLAHSLKYEEVTTFGVQLGRNLSEKITSASADVLLPVPLNRRKERERGYNQSDLIAFGLSERTGIPVDRDSVRRVRYTVTQTHLNAEQRGENIADAFRVSRPEQIIGKRIAVVDDIITTGSTIQELGKILKEAGAASVIAVSAALAKLDKDR